MQTIAQLEENISVRPNSIEISEALADEYVKQQRWQEAVEVYRSLLALYPATASLFVNRIRLGAAALGISSLLILIAELIHPLLPSVELYPSAFARSLASPKYLTAQILILLAFPLFSTAAISVYKLLSYTHDHRPAFWAMVFSVIGIGLSMPALGINTIILPLMARLYLTGELETFNLYTAMQALPWYLSLRFGGYVLVLGIAVFSWVILRNKNFPKRSAIIFLAGWILFTAPITVSRLSMSFTGFLIFAGGLELAHSTWIQAPLQFKPVTDSLQKADS